MTITSATELLIKFKKHPFISTDSRKVMPGSLFFALKGDKFNANLFSATALENGAAYAIIDDPAQYSGERTLLVKDVLESLQELASLYRSELKIPIIGITGTNGKTTTKELVATALSARYKTLSTPGNFNNHIGVPLTLLSIKPDTEIAVVEMGANHPGEITSLCHIARPTHGLITNIGKAHLEGFGNFQGVIKAKKELYDYLDQYGGRVFVNSGNELLMQLSENSHRVTYGTRSDDTVQGTPVSEESFLKINMEKPLKSVITTNLAGSYNFENAMAAFCIANHFKVEPDLAIAAISAYVPGMNRSQVVHSGSNTLILDAYNANPSSMKAAIDNFNHLKAGNKILILGDMFELGPDSPVEHRAILDLIAQHQYRKVITAGPIFYQVAEGFKDVECYATTGELKEALTRHPLHDSTILIKGSRGMMMETIVDIL